MYKILITDKIDKSVIDQIKNPKFSFDYQPEITPQDLIKIIPDYQGLVVRSRTKVTREVIDRGHDLKIIGRVGSGLDNIEIKEAKKRKITVINSPESNSEAVAELTLALIISLLRKLSLANSSMTNGLWIKKDLKGEELEGKNIGNISYYAKGKPILSNIFLNIQTLSRFTCR